MDYHAIFVLLCIFSGATAQFIVEPSNTVVLDGAANTTFSCAPNVSTHRINWQAQSVSGLTFAFNCVLEPGYNTTYRVVKNPATGQCDLVIISASSSVAERYTCVNANAPPTVSSRNAELVVLDSPLRCTQQQHVIDGEQMWFNCSVNYTTGTVVPYFDCDDNGQNLTIDSNSSTTTSAILQAYIDIPVATTTPPADIKPVTFTMNFPPPTIYHVPYSWTSNETKVQFSPINLDITGADFTDPVYLYTVISCSADAYPAPRYEWQNYTDDNSTLGSEQTYNLTVSGNYTLQCVVTAPIETSTRASDPRFTDSVRQFVMVSDSTAPPTTTPEPRGKSCSENPGCIVPAIVVPITVVIIITIICCCIFCSCCPCYNRCKRCRCRCCDCCPCDNAGKTGNADITSNNSEPQKDA